MDEILNNLQKIKDLRVISRTSVEQFRNTPKSIPEIAKELGVNYVVEGSGQKYGSTFSLRVQLIKAAKENHLWAESYNQEIKNVNDIYSIQSQIAQKISTELKATITPGVKQLIEKPPTDNLEAYTFYKIGNYLMSHWTEDAFRKAIDQYKKAIALDSSFATAYSGLASSYFELSIWDVPVPSSEFIQQAKDWALKALEINKNIGDAHFVIGAIKYVHEWDWNGAEQAFKKGMELNPNYVYGRMGYANFLTAMGRFEESITIGQQTLKLNPLDPAVYNELAFAMFFNGQYEKALELYNKSLDINPNFEQTSGLLVIFYTRKGLFDQAISNWGKRMELNNNDIRKISAFSLGVAGQAFGMAGRRDEAITLINELNRRAGEGEYSPASCRALIYIGLGENEKAINFLEKGFDEKETLMVWLKVNSVFDPLRSNERFKKLLRKMRFEE
jgi:tetratricopeptide (TPR) repeat protein